MSLFEKSPNYPHRIKVGQPCQNCPHTHMDHSYYTRMCLIEKCLCQELKLDVKPIEFTPPKRP